MTEQPAQDHPRRSSAESAALVIVDVQERLFIAIPTREKVAANIGLMADVAGALDMPVVVTEHMAGSIGHTVADVVERLPDGIETVAKSHFSAWDERGFCDAIAALAANGRTDFAICGMETHVCVQQTALGLLAGGHTVRVVVDACGSRGHEDRAVAIERLRDAGADIVTAEAIAFEWLRRGDTPAFKKLLKTIRDRRKSVETETESEIKA